MAQAKTGQPLLRNEDPALLQGQALFTADLREPELDGALYAAFVRSPVAAGTIVGIEVSEALLMPGVVGAATGADITDPAPFALPLEGEVVQPLLPRTDIRFAGQAVAVVVAESAALAADAAEAVSVEITAAAPILDIGQALAETAVEATRHEVPHDPTKFDCDIVVELQQWSPRQLPAPLECRAVAAVEVEGRMLVWAATQTPHAFKGNLARLLSADPSTVRVQAPAVGGGFGGKVGRTAEEYLVPLMAQRLGRPVRWDETRSEYFATATQGRGERITLRLAGTSAGKITALRADFVKDGGAYPLVGVMLANGYTSKIANGCYDIPHVEFNSVGVLTNRPPTSAYRGAGRSPYIGALERAVDCFASKVGLDPAVVREVNLIRPDQMPYTTPTGAVYDEADYPGDLKRALAAIDIDSVREQQAASRVSAGPNVLGVGITAYNHMTTGGGGEEAMVTVDRFGSATVVTGTTSQGHGHATTWAQIASDVLGIPVDQIEVVEGDTDAIATGVGAVGSRSLQTAGMAIHRAATEVVSEAKKLAADLLEAAVDDIVQSDDGLGFHVIGTPVRSVTWGQVANEANEAEVSCGDFYDTDGRNTFPSGVHVAVVEVDVETGAVEVLRLLGVDDAGVVVNPLIVEGQIHGGMASAVGQVLGEVVVHDQLGNQLTSSLMDYPIPSADQLPFFETQPSATASSFNSLGFKGVGESGTVGATGALHNAVLDALAHLDVHHFDLPCTPERVWTAIQEARTAGA